MYRALILKSHFYILNPRQHLNLWHVGNCNPKPSQMVMKYPCYTLYHGHIHKKQQHTNNICTANLHKRKYSHDTLSSSFSSFFPILIILRFSQLDQLFRLSMFMAPAAGPLNYASAFLEAGARTPGNVA